MNYKRSRDLAWDVLIRNHIDSLPVNVMDICRRENIHVFPFSAAKELLMSVDVDIDNYDSDALCFGNYIIYNDNAPSYRQRFSIAHELGHMLLHLERHVEKPACAKSISEGMRNPYRTDKPDTESEADIFASRLLAPLCVLQLLGVNSTSQIMRLCDMGYHAANIRYRRLTQVRHKSAERRREKSFGTFFLSKQERLVADNFRSFIENNTISK